jgi:1-acyl-sn-glycerol-3-phosphate acyltransferase
VAPLRAADDATVITTDGNTFDQTVDVVVATIEAALGGGSAEARAPAGTARSGEPEPGRQASAPARAEGSGAGSSSTGAGSSSTGTGSSSTGDAARGRRTGLLEVAMRLDNQQTTMIRYIALLSRTGARLFADVDIRGLERIPRTGAVILALNHVSNADAFFTGSWISDALRTRRIHWLGKRELFDWPIFGWLAAHGGIHPVDRGTADVEAYRLATRILDAGYVLLIFPEGTRSPDGALQEAKDGLAGLAMRTGATIVPIGINGSDRVWPRGRKIPLPIPRHTVRVRIGEPFKVADVVPADADRRTAKTLATRAIMGRIAALLEPRHRGFYADAVPPGTAEVEPTR